MLSKTKRFHGSRSLKRVYAQGKTVRGPLFAVRVLANEQRTQSRVAIVVSRKVCKSAVGRNRIRRRLYGAFKRAEKNLLSPSDIVITVFHDTVLHTPAQTLEGQLANQLAASGKLLKP